MGILDNLSWALRHCRKRLFESILIISAIGLGVAVIVAILAMIFFARAETRKSLEQEWMRTFHIYSAAHISSSSMQEAILRVVQERPTQPLQVSLDELRDLQESLPSGMHVFAEQTMLFPSRLLPKPVNESEESFGSQYEVLGPARVVIQDTAPQASRIDTVVITRDAVGVFEVSSTEVEAEEAFDTESPASTVSGPMVMEVPIPEQKVVTIQEMLSWREQYDYIDVVGTTLSYFDFKQYQIAKGTLFVESDITNGNRVMILSEQLAVRVFGDSDPIGQTIPILATSSQQEISFTVIGVFAPFEGEDNYASERYRAFVPYTALPGLWSTALGQDVILNNFTIGVDKGIDLAKASEIIQAEIRQRYGELGTVSNSYITTSSAARDNYSIYIIIAVFASLGLIIAVINILNLMLARVLRRTKAIGLSIALGSTKGAVFRQFLLEAVLLGLTGAFIGIPLGYAMLNGVMYGLLRTFVPFGWETIAAGCGLGFLVSLMFGVYPAYQGASINPVDTLRNE
ncbi:MAG TPA: ABC transporter permease [Limnochordia bacterium]|nr:ABC transporter permease [Limnochordia bacterium]